MELRRMWINLPPTHKHYQQYHELHGMRVLADTGFDAKWTQVWFTSGDVLTMDLPADALSPGWPPEVTL